MNRFLNLRMAAAVLGMTLGLAACGGGDAPPAVENVSSGVRAGASDKERAALDHAAKVNAERLDRVRPGRTVATQE
jgi:hypothetical protein